ncbi:MAG TPA: hypothetical protein VHC43_14665 [Mycobacteriales bacterium]|nr:hypothetical protein [Mycobacteriales bacterium]
MTYRIYRWCSDDPRPPCDTIKGNEILNGGHATLRLRPPVTLARGITTASAVVTSASDPALRGTTTRLKVAHGLLTVGFLAGSSFCRPNAWQPACGA